MPYSVLGRTVGVIWMIIGLAVHGMFSAVLTSTLVSSEGALQYTSINTFDDIRVRLQEDSTRRLCVVKDTYVATRVTSLSFAESVVLGDNLADCYGQLEDGTVRAASGIWHIQSSRCMLETSSMQGCSPWCNNGVCR